MLEKRSKTIRSSDVESLLRLSHEVMSLPADSTTRRAHVLSGLCRLVGARAGAVAFYPYGAVHVRFGTRTIALDTHPVLWGFEPGENKLVHQFFATPIPRDPMFDYLERLPGEYCSHRREEFVSDRDWYRSEYFNVLRKRINVDAQIYARLPADDGRIMTISICRGLGEGRFGQRETTLIDLFNRTLGQAYEPIVPRAVKLRKRLSPYLRRVLDRLLQGDSEKEAGRNLGLSIHTVHQYAKQIYKIYDVASRAELMAQFIELPAGARVLGQETRNIEEKHRAVRYK